MKTCKICKQTKPINKFHTHRTGKYGVSSKCGECDSLKRKLYAKSKVGVITSIYSTQRNSSRYRGHHSPKYTLGELREWVLSQPLYDKLYEQWVDSNHSSDLKPSIDRIDDYVGYCFSNIQLMTWRENQDKAAHDRLNCINTKNMVAIIQLSLNSKIIQTFPSARKAARTLNINHSHITSCCRGRGKTAGGFKWEYAS